MPYEVMTGPITLNLSLFYSRLYFSSLILITLYSYNSITKYFVDSLSKINFINKQLQRLTIFKFAETKIRAMRRDSYFNVQTGNV